MTMNPDPSPLPPPPSAMCGNCGADEGRLLHHVRHRGLFRRLCTTCVLRLHPQSFCPSCFSLFSLPPPPSQNTVSCSKCYSSTHPSCLLGPATSSPYVCPLCRRPNSPIFDPKGNGKKIETQMGNGKKIETQKGIGEKIENQKMENATKTEAQMENVRKIDRESARVLLAAAKIASLSMGKAAVAARAEAERRAKEAAFTRKRARDALEHVALLVGREKPKRREIAVVEASGNGVDGPSEVSARLNAVGLTEGLAVQTVSQNNGLQHLQEKVGGEGIIDPQ